MVSHNFHILTLKSVIPYFVECLVFLGMAFSFIRLNSSLDTLTKCKAAIKKIHPPAIITSAEEWNMPPFSANRSAQISIIT